MQANYRNGDRARVLGLDKDEAIKRAGNALEDPEVESVTVFKDPSTDMGLSRHERRRWRHEVKVYNRAAVRTKRKKRK